MLVSIAKLLAYVAFAFARPFVFVRQNRTLLSLFTVTAVASVLATLGATVLLGARGAPLTENADASALGSFVSANGTTANEWQIAGPNGPGFVDDAGALDLLPNVSLAGAPGTGALQMGQMTGSTTLPTGNLSWSGATGKALTCSAKATSSITTTTGNMTIDAPGDVNIGSTLSSGNVNIGNNTNDPTINIGDQSGGSSFINIAAAPDGTGNSGIFIGNAFGSLSPGQGVVNVYSKQWQLASNATVGAVDYIHLGDFQSLGGDTNILPNQIIFTVGPVVPVGYNIGVGGCNNPPGPVQPLNIFGQDNINCQTSPNGNAGAVNIMGGAASSIATDGGVGGAVTITGGTAFSGTNVLGGSVDITGGLGVQSGSVVVSIPGSILDASAPSGGVIQANIAAATLFTVATSGFEPGTAAGTLACSTGGTQTVPSQSFGIVVTTGTLSSNCIIDFGTNAQTGLYIVDMSGVSLGATFGVQFKNGSATKTFISTSIVSGSLATVWTHGANTLAVNF